jgi:catechol 2,3-dioxygenase-like lactoylglutathione lyase family enzyme
MKGVFHTGITVSNLERSIEFYRDVIGFKLEIPPTEVFEGDAEKTMKELEAKGVKFLSSLNIVEEGALAGWKWVYFKDPDGITLELVEYNPPEK